MSRFALARVAGRELAWGLPSCAAEVRRWRAHASAIPDPGLRADALDGLTRKRPHLDGAALFATLLPRRSSELLRALVAFQAILEYLDGVNERAAGAGVRNGLRLHLALRDALDPSSPPVDYYLHNPARHDGGYLRALVAACRRACVALPSYAALRPTLLDHSRSLEVLALNHEPDSARRDLGLRRWAGEQRAARGDERWHELAGEATGSLTIHGLLCLAARERVHAHEVERALAVYPRFATLATMLDSYVDRALDAEQGSHSYIAHYSPDEAVERLAALIRECFAAAPTLPGGHRNTVLLASMVAMYLSADGVRGETSMLIGAGGALTGTLVPVLRAWRLAHRLPDA